MTTTLKLVLHPNEERAEILLPVKINRELYSFTRKKEAKGKERFLVNHLEATVGIRKVEVQGERISIDVQPAFNPSEWFPGALVACKKFFPKENSFEVILDDRRWLKAPVYKGEDDWTPAVPGVKMPDGETDLGIGAYTVFKAA